MTETETEIAVVLPPGIDPLLTDRQIATALQVSEETVRRERKRGHMPAVVRISPRRHGTRQSLFQQWMRDRERAPSK